VAHKTIIIIGPGKVGTSLFRALRQVERCRLYMAGNKPLPDQLARQIPAERYIDLSEAFTQVKADLLIFTVPDDRINGAAEKAVTLCPPGAVAVHTSGAVNSDCLKVLKEHGAQTASWHPLQSFSRRFLSGDIWKGITTTFEGDAGAESTLRDICGTLGCTLLPLNRKQKFALHTASVFAANFLPALLAAGQRILKQEGIDSSRTKALLIPLMFRSLKNIEENPPEKALSGPLQRGDLGTLDKHLTGLRRSGHYDLAELYRLLSGLLAEEEQFDIINREQVLKWLSKQ